MWYNIILLEFSMFFYMLHDYVTVTFVTVMMVVCNIMLTLNSKSKIKYRNEN